MTSRDKILESLPPDCWPTIHSRNAEKWVGSNKTATPSERRCETSHHTEPCRLNAPKSSNRYTKQTGTPLTAHKQAKQERTECPTQAPPPHGNTRKPRAKETTTKDDQNQWHWNPTQRTRRILRSLPRRPQESRDPRYRYTAQSTKTITSNTTSKLKTRFSTQQQTPKEESQTRTQYIQDQLKHSIQRRTGGQATKDQ